MNRVLEMKIGVGIAVFALVAMLYIVYVWRPENPDVFFNTFIGALLGVTAGMFVMVHGWTKGGCR